MREVNISNRFCVFLCITGLVGTINALNSDCGYFWDILSSCNSKVVPIQTTSQLDTADDFGGWNGWSADSKFYRDHLYYAKSSSEIDIDILNLAKPEDFNPDAFVKAEGIWYFPFQVLFENSNDPIVLTTASFNYSGATIFMTNVYVRYYLHGSTNTSFQVCSPSGCSEELYNNNELEEWQEVLINLNEMDDDVYDNMEDDAEVDETTALLIYVEFQTYENNSGYFLVDKIIISTPEPSNPTTTTLRPEVTQASTIPGETEPTTVKETTTGTTEEPGTVLTTTEGDQPSSTPSAGTRLKTMTIRNLIVTIVVFIVVHACYPN